MDFDGVVFAGGGCRCFWQAGFWSVVAPAIELKPRAIAAVSAGVAFACAAVAGTLDDVVRDFVRRTAANPRNFYPTNSLRRRPIFPHGQMYRGAVLATTDATVLQRIRSGPEIRALVAHPPRHIQPTLALVMAFAAYRVDRAVRRSVHPTLGRRLGFRQQVVLANDCETPEQLADLILQSSCMPPITPQYRRDGEVVVDGGVLDGAPASLLSDCSSVLVLLTRQFPRLPRAGGHHYVQPVPADPPVVVGLHQPNTGAGDLRPRAPRWRALHRQPSSHHGAEPKPERLTTRR